MSAIDDKYAELGGSGGFLGEPASTEQQWNPNVVFRLYEHGAIYAQIEPPRVHEVHGAIWLNYQSFGAQSSPLGLPTTDESSCPDGVGRYNNFSEGSIRWHPTTGAHETHGAIHALWSSMNWETSLLGYPLTDESPCPDGVGRFNHFQNGSIYWSPQTGAHEVHGAIRDRWRDGGWERSPLGYPRTSEYRTIDALGAGKRLRISSFERGFLAYDEASGAVVQSAPYSFDGLIATITPIYWGTEWNPQNPVKAGQSWEDVDRALAGLITAGIGDGLRGYGVRSVMKAAPTWLNEQVPDRFRQAPPFGDPPNPKMGFTDKDLTDRIVDAVTNGQAPWPMHRKIAPDGLPELTDALTCYLVILPQGCHFSDDPWGEAGHHSAFTFQAPGWDTIADIRFAWIGQDETLDSTIQTCIHEFVEAYNDAAGLEIGDRCKYGDPHNPKNDGFDATIAGVSVRSYWSNFHNRCIAPPAPDPKTHQIALE
jgi:LGFP repeat-containing protein